MSLMEETGARVRSGASLTDDVVTCYCSEVCGETGRAKASGSTSTWRSTPVEWEVTLGSQLPFRQAQDSLTFVTHGATTLEDSTIARHGSRIGAVIDTSWTYRCRSDIEEFLRTRTTCNRENDRPLLYLSPDAHAPRRYVDDSFEAP
jgi:hypothetical protein